MLRGLRQYRVLKCLAQGSQGVVYLALDSRLSRRVCIKLYTLTGALSLRRRAREEAWQLTRVDSPLTVQVYDVVASGESLALVTAYVPGCNLEDLIHAGDALTPAHALDLAADIATALAALRRARLVHGDLSARNVLVNPDGRAILTDFGVAGWSGDRSLGVSFDAMSPEQSHGIETDFRSDFFALGLLLYRMLYNKHAFYSAGEVDVPRLRDGLRAVPALPGVDEQCNGAIRALLLSLCAADPIDRPLGVPELRESLREVRGILGAPESLRPAVLRIAQNKAPIDTPLLLPEKLVRLPMRQHASAWINRYWRSGSAGARAVLLILTVIPLLTALLYTVRPGVCVEIREARIRASTLSSQVFPEPAQARELLTSAFKEVVPGAVALGLGPASDSVLHLSPLGVRDVCTAQHSLQLEIDCAEGRCTLTLEGRSPTQISLSEISIAAASGLRGVRDALVQLILQQVDVFLGDA